MKEVLRKLIIVLIIIVPAFSYSGCNKQVRCGCGKDIVYSFTGDFGKIYYNDTKTNVSFVRTNNPYATYNFCNPGEMAPKLDNYKSGDVVQIWGDVFYDCNQMYQSANYTYGYGNLFEVYLIEVTDVYVDPYGKK